MINKIKGIVTEKKEKLIDFSISSGITFEIFIAHTNAIEINKEYELFIFMHFNTEKGYTLYGFLTEVEKTYFMLLQDCHGIGNKLAMQIISQLPLEILYEAVVQQNKSIFESISGVGKKKAELIILELKNKIHKLPSLDKKNNISLHHEDLQQALLALGYDQKEVNKTLNKLYSEYNTISNHTLSELISLSLQQ